jgi:hypothetical protein
MSHRRAIAALVLIVSPGSCDHAVVPVLKLGMRTCKQPPAAEPIATPWD